MSEAPTTADLDRIKRMIPHRDPFLMIDRVTDMRNGDFAIGRKAVTGKEYFFEGHFPGRPIMPGVLIVEAMAQTAAVLVVQTLDMVDQGKLVYFMTVDKTKFRAPVEPGADLELYVTVQRSKGRVWKFDGVGKVGDTVVAQAEFSAMIVDPE
jgi:3-hydroxyacyl-[acyl-carrier-protein] dehydratase